MVFIPRNDLKLWILCTNQVWNLVNPPEGIKPNRSNFDGIINRFDFIKNMDKPCVYKMLVWGVLFS